MSSQSPTGGHLDERKVHTQRQKLCGKVALAVEPPDEKELFRG
jgi:hypothetical protein